MNTKTFAQQSRTILMQGVAKKLLYWGFTENGEVQEQPQKISGGYSFRGEVFDDATVPNLWDTLANAVKQNGIEVVVEEAAYTWFNRFMALQILAKNGYEAPQLENAPGLEHTPIILQNARQGQFSFLNSEEQVRLQKVITDYTKDQEAFAILIKGYCHSHNTLNRVFGKIDDYTELLLPDNMLQDGGFLHLLNTTDAISDEAYQEVELIGWLYQFYISEKKDEVFASFKKNKKAEAKDIPAATQIFTPNWIVKYMVENTAGKIWLDKHPDSPLKTNMKYLVTNDSDVSSSAERIENKAIINSVEDLTLIDPACGSGHILVEGFDLLYQMYLEEYYEPEEAVESILKHNLYGLDIDDRAAQLSNFAILLKAAKVFPAIWTKDWLPNVYAMPESSIDNWFYTRSYSKADWNELQGMKLAEDVTIEWQENKKNKLVKKTVTYKTGTILNEATVDKLKQFHEGQLMVDYSRELELFWGDFEKPYNYNQFYYAIELLKQGKNLGSTIKLNLDVEVIENIKSTFNEWLEREEEGELNLEEQIVFKELKAFVPVLLILTKKYSSVVANPPYMGQKNMNAELKNFVNLNYPRSKSDLFAVFMESTLAMNVKNGLMGMINQHSWMFLSSYEKLRNHLLDNYSISNMLHLGPRTFEELSGEVVQSTAFVIENGKTKETANYYRLLDHKDVHEKKTHFLNRENEYVNIPQTNFSKIPGSPIAYWVSERIIRIFEEYPILKKWAISDGKNVTGDNNLYVKFIWEVSGGKVGFEKKWLNYTKGGGYRKWYGNVEHVINWSQETRTHYRKSKVGRLIPEYLWEKEGVSWNWVASGAPSFRFLKEKDMFDAGAPTVFFEEKKQLNESLGLLNSKVSEYFLKILNPTVNFPPRYIQAIPKKEVEFPIEKVVLSNQEISKKDWDSFETSWDFEQSPLLNEAVELESAFTTWTQNVKEDFFQLHANEEELNRIFIDIYGLQEELTPEVALKDITILQNELDRKALERLEPAFRTEGKDAIELPIDKGEVVSQFISYCIGLMMGRYRLDKLGLNIAHPNPTLEEFGSYSYNGQHVEIDEDAIVPLMGSACNFPDDALQRVYGLLDTIWGADTRTANINFVQDCLNKELEQFLVKDFYKYHCKMYKKKPIYWLFSSKKGAFQVLVYMHRMNAFTVEKIRANYLLEHLKNLQSEITLLENNASSLNTAESKRLDLLRKQYQECEAYDIELKDIADQQITFDLDDGVSVNYKKFESIVAKIK